MTTTIRITFPNGEAWDVKADPIARARADYYATEVDGHENGSAEYMKEVDYALSESGQSYLIDYAQNNLNWLDLKPHAKQVCDPTPTDHEMMLSEAEWEAQS